jgi:hypothetical protein
MPRRVPCIVSFRRSRPKASASATAACIYSLMFLCGMSTRNALSTVGPPPRPPLSNPPMICDAPICSHRGQAESGRDGAARQCRPEMRSQPLSNPPLICDAPPIVTRMVARSPSRGHRAPWPGDTRYRLVSVSSVMLCVSVQSPALRGFGLSAARRVDRSRVPATIARGQDTMTDHADAVGQRGGARGG